MESMWRKFHESIELDLERIVETKRLCGDEVDPREILPERFFFATFSPFLRCLES